MQYSTRSVIRKIAFTSFCAKKFKSFFGTHYLMQSHQSKATNTNVQQLKPKSCSEILTQMLLKQNGTFSDLPFVCVLTVSFLPSPPKNKLFVLIFKNKKCATRYYFMYLDLRNTIFVWHNKNLIQFSSNAFSSHIETSPIDFVKEMIFLLIRYRIDPHILSLSLSSMNPVTRQHHLLLRMDLKYPSPLDRKGTNSMMHYL